MKKLSVLICILISSLCFAQSYRTDTGKIEGEYWYISYDDGLTWEKLYKAAGEEGQNGYSMFENVDVSNQEYVLMTLTDGMEIKI